MAKKRVVIFTVTGHGEFPLDMLRHDACYPATQEDVVQLYHAEAGNPKERSVTLRHRIYPDERVGAIPCTDRWDSFRWFVSNVRYD